MKNISEALAQQIFRTFIDDDDRVEENYWEKLMQIIKGEFNATTERSTRMKIFNIS